MDDCTELIGVTDIAHRYGVVQPTVSAWAKKPTFPEPATIQRGTGGPRGGYGGPGQVRRLWRFEDVERWYEQAVARGEVRGQMSDAR